MTTLRAQLLLVVSLWMGVALWQARTPQPATSDGACYVVLSQSLAEGKGFRQIDAVGEPQHNMFPFLYPLMLAGTRLLGCPAAFLWTVNLAFGLAFMLLVLRLFRSHFPEGLAPPILLSSGMGCFLLYALLPMADLPAALFLLLGAAATERYGAASRVLGKEFLLAAGPLLAAVWTRNAGLAAAPAVFLWLIVDAPRKEGRWSKAALLTATIVSGWLVWTFRAWASGGQAGAVTLECFFLRRDPYHPESGSLNLGAILGRLHDNGVFYPAFYASSAAAGFSPSPWACWLLTGFMGIGFLERCLWKRTIIEHVMGFYGLMLWFGHVAGARYLIPILPFLLAYAARGALWLARWDGIRVPKAFLALLWLLALGDTAWRVVHPMKPEPEEVALVEVSRWIGAHAQPGDLVLCENTETVFLESGCQGIWIGHGPERVRAALAIPKVRWIVLDEADHYGRVSRAGMDVLVKDAGAFRLCFRKGSHVAYELVGKPPCP